MKLYTSLHQLPADGRRSIVTIGNFDGVHCGHRMVIRTLIKRAREVGASAVAVTFDPHPVRVLHPERDLRLITPLPRKLELLEQCGLDAVLALPFTEEFSRWSAHDFAARVLRDGLRTVEVHEGESFRFGYDAAEDIKGLAQLGTELGFKVHACSPFLLRGAPISSSRIRALISSGEMAKARALLGRSFSITANPASGRGYGTRFAVPTINLAPYPELVPANGVYITLVRISGSGEQHLFRAVTNAGNRPTFGADSYAIESHLLDFYPLELHETSIVEVTFLKRLREEVRFASPEALKSQIAIDLGRARNYFRLVDALSKTADTTGEVNRGFHSCGGTLG